MSYETEIIPPANLNISPPLLLTVLTSSSMYLLIANAVSSAPSGPIFYKVSVRLVKPLISANITTDLNCYFAGSSFILLFHYKLYE
jgi:hypothetical protein